MTDYVNGHIYGERNGQREGLIVVGKSRTGKTDWAESHGTYIQFVKNWDIKNVGEGFDYVVVHDVVLKDISSFRYWGEILGRQKSFDAFDRYKNGEKIPMYLGMYLWQ
jgi:hypothetical protein